MSAEEDFSFFLLMMNIDDAELPGMTMNTDDIEDCRSVDEDVPHLL